MGELATLVLLLREIQVGFLDDSLNALFLGLLILGVVGVGLYSWIRIGATIEWKPAPAALAGQATHMAASLASGD